VECPSTGPCTESYCTSNGCVSVPRACNPLDLTCATGSCDKITDQCYLNTARCKIPAGVKDCCNVNTGAPYCNNATIYNCVCAMDETCCIYYWHYGCVDLVKYCSARDCLKEKLPLPRNTFCSNTVMVKNIPISYTTYTIAGDKTQATCFGETEEESGVWYSFVGNGSFLTISTCYGQSTGPTSIRIFDKCNGTCLLWEGETENCGYKSTLTFTPENGVTYLAFVTADPINVVTVSFFTPTPGNEVCPSGQFKVLPNTRGICPGQTRSALSVSDAQNLCLLEPNCVGYSYNEQLSTVDICTDPHFVTHVQQGFITGICSQLTS